MKVSIIVPTVGRPLLVRCLEHIRKLEYDYYETLIVLARGDADPLKIKLNDNERLISNEEGSVSHGMNLGASNATGEVLAFVADDVLVPPDWLKKSVKYFQDPRVAVVSGPNLTPPESNALERCFGHVHSSCFASFVMSKRFRLISFTKNNADETELCGVALFRKSAFEAVGGFMLHGACQENDLFHRLKESGFSLVYTPDAWVYHYRRKDIKGFFYQTMVSGNGRWQYFRLHPHELMSKFYMLIPLFFLLYVLALPVLVMISIYLLIPIVVYFLCAFLSAIEPAYDERSLKAFVILPFLFFVQHVAYGLGFMTGLSGHRIRRWR